MANTISSALAEGKQGFYIGHRIILPFNCQILKLIIDGEIYTEMVGGKHIKLHQDPNNTSVYVRSAGKLSNFVGSYKHVKMIIAELDADLCDPTTHQKVICEIEEGHILNIHTPDEDDLFIE